MSPTPVSEMVLTEGVHLSDQFPHIYIIVMDRSTANKQYIEIGIDTKDRSSRDGQWQIGLNVGPAGNDHQFMCKKDEDYSLSLTTS